MATIAKAIEGGHLSGGRAASLLDLTKDQVGVLCESYGIERPVELGPRRQVEEV